MVTLRSQQCIVIPIYVFIFLRRYFLPSFSFYDGGGALNINVRMEVVKENEK